ncbi:hypothetical protein PENSPDRAFT_682525 [Peniophora sp. CONT]|nr:hypothetical protein PENSPDRAFT_682525 [Peniophora sp. CONT]
MHDKFMLELSTAFSEGIPRATLLKELDDELERGRQRQCHMQECRNLLASPICLLAPEILSHIFFIYAHNEDHKALFSLSWTSLLTVCRRWKDVCIESPKLWSYIHIGHLPTDAKFPSHSAMIRRLNMQRERSKSYPLTVKLDNLYIVTSSLLSPYASWLWRPDGLLSLSVHGDSSCVADVLARLDDSEHPRLAHFEVRTCDFGDLMLAVSDDFLADKLTHLRDLALTDALFSWNAIHDLRGLSIKFCDTFPVVYKLQDAIDALYRCPALEHLELTLQKGVTPVPDSTPSPVALPSLKHASLQGSLSACIYLLQSMVLPAEASTSVIVTGPNSDYNPILYRALATRLKAHTRTPIRSLAVKQNEFGACLSLSASMHTDLSVLDTSPRTSYRTPELRIVFPADPNTAFILMDVLEAWSARNSLTHLDLRAAQDCPPSLWSGLFALLPALTTVAVCPEWPSATSLLELLRRESVHLSTPLSHIIFDADSLRPSSTIHRPARLASALKIARASVLTLLEYCAQVRHEGRPLGVFEIMNVEGDQLLGGLPIELLCRDADFIQNGRRSARLPPMVSVGLTSATRDYWIQFPLHLPLQTPATSYPTEL